MVEQNLTRAAAKLSMTQPAVSNALRRLRDLMGDDLLIRTAFGVKPTAKAELLWPPIRSALDRLEACIAPEILNIQDIKATLKIATVDAFAAIFLPFLIEMIEKYAPLIDVSMIQLTDRDPRPLLTHAEIDLAVGIFPGISAQLAGSQVTTVSPIRHEHLFTRRYVCVMRKDHPLAFQELTLEAFCNANHLQVSLSGQSLSQVDQVLEQMGKNRCILLTLNQYFCLGQILVNSDLITTMPEHLLSIPSFTNQMISKELPFFLADESCDVLWHERDTRNPVHAWLRQTLRNFIQTTSHASFC